MYLSNLSNYEMNTTSVELKNKSLNHYKIKTLRLNYAAVEHASYAYLIDKIPEIHCVVETFYSTI